MPVLHRLLASGMAAAIVALGAEAAPLRAQAPTPAQDPPWDVTRARGVTRKISFTTDEGTWLSPDVSPDGRSFLVGRAMADSGDEIVVWTGWLQELKAQLAERRGK